MIVLLGLLVAKDPEYPTDLMDFQEKNIQSRNAAVSPAGTRGRCP